MCPGPVLSDDVTSVCELVRAFLTDKQSHTQLFMLKNQSENCQSMTIQNIECLSQNKSETMQGISEKSNNPPQQITASNNKNGHISFSVASLLADTRPTKASSPSSTSLRASPTAPSHSSDEDYDSNQEDSIVDVEDLNNSDQKSLSPEKDQHDIYVSQAREREFQMQQGPIRPTPFSALAAAVYQAAHPNWASQGLVGHFPGPGPIFQGPASFGVPNLTAGMFLIR